MVAEPFAALRPFARLVVERAQAHGLDPALLAGLVLFESGANPRAISAAGATGLGQVMPREAGPQFRDRPSRQELLDPETNLEWSARILGANLRRSRGSVPAALRAYLGGDYDPYTGVTGGQYVQAIVSTAQRVGDWLAQATAGPAAAAATLAPTPAPAAAAAGTEGSGMAQGDEQFTPGGEGGRGAGRPPGGGHAALLGLLQQREAELRAALDAARTQMASTEAARGRLTGELQQSRAKTKKSAAEKDREAELAAAIAALPDAKEQRAQLEELRKEHTTALTTLAAELKGAEPARLPQHIVLDGDLYQQRPDGTWGQVIDIKKAPQLVPGANGGWYQYDPQQERYVPAVGLPVAPPKTITTTDQRVIPVDPTTGLPRVAEAVDLRTPEQVAESQQLRDLVQQVHAQSVAVRTMPDGPEKDAALRELAGLAATTRGDPSALITLLSQQAVTTRAELTRLEETTGIQHQLTDGRPVPMTDPATGQPVPTAAEQERRRVAERAKQQDEAAEAERRRQAALGLSSLEAQRARAGAASLAEYERSGVATPERTANLRAQLAPLPPEQAAGVLGMDANSPQFRGIWQAYQQLVAGGPASGAVPAPPAAAAPPPPPAAAAPAAPRPAFLDLLPVPRPQQRVGGLVTEPELGPLPPRGRSALEQLLVAAGLAPAAAGPAGAA